METWVIGAGLLPIKTSGPSVWFVLDCRGHILAISSQLAGWDLDMQTVVHVTHEAIQKIGGIGAVLHGLLTSRVYLDKVPRNILVGPFWPGEETGDRRLGSNGEVLYSSLDHLYRSPLASRFREIEQTYGVGIVYGRRKFVEKTGYGRRVQLHRQFQTAPCSGRRYHGCSPAPYRLG